MTRHYVRDAPMKLTWAVFAVMLLAEFVNGPEGEPNGDEPGEPPPPPDREPGPGRPERDAPPVPVSVAVALIATAILILILVWTGR